MLNKILRPVISKCVTKPIIIRSIHSPTIGRIVSTPTENLPKTISVKGWVKSLRKQKQNSFIDISDGLSGQHLQVVAETKLIPELVNFHSCVKVEGNLIKSNHPKQPVELLATKLELINNCSEDYPFQPRTFAKSEYVRRQPSCKAKSNSVSSLLRIRNCASQAVHQYFQNQDFVQVHTPVLTSNDCEGGGEVFSVSAPSSPDDGPYWDTPVHLTVSGQLHLEAICNGISRVYCFNPAFRAERGRTRRHLSEFWMVEAEIAFVDELQTIIETMEDLLKHCAQTMLDKCSADLELYAKATKGKSNVDNIEKFVNSNIVIMSYNEATDLLSKQKDLGPLQDGDLGREHEQWLCHHTGGCPVAVVNWPSLIKPFYMRSVPSEPSLVSGVDLLVPGVGELCGGSLREMSHQALEDRLGDGDHGLDWYLQMRRQGAAQTGGFGLGFERMLQFFIGVENIKDTIPFHRSPHSCML